MCDFGYCDNRLTEYHSWLVVMSVLAAHMEKFMSLTIDQEDTEHGNLAEEIKLLIVSEELIPYN